jgi:hypothetical protein
MKFLVSLWIVLLVGLILAGCQAGYPTPDPPETQPADLVAQAQAEATAIIQQARATALVQEARNQANALLTPARQPAFPAASVESITSTEVEHAVSAVPTQVAGPGEATAQPGMPTDSRLPVTVIARQGDVELIDVTIAPDSGFIFIDFIAPPSLSSQLYQGQISVTDEASGEVYNEIPVMPVIGPLIGRPVLEGQRGYVLLTNRPPWLRTGAVVTVVIAGARFEHIPVE